MNLNISPRYLQFRGPNGESPIPFLPCEGSVSGRHDGQLEMRDGKCRMERMRLEKRVWFAFWMSSCCPFKSYGSMRWDCVGSSLNV